MFDNGDAKLKKKQGDRKCRGVTLENIVWEAINEVMTFE